MNLIECFNSPYGTQYFKEYAESVPNGLSCEALKDAAVKNKVCFNIGASVIGVTTECYNGLHVCFLGIPHRGFDP